MKTILYVFLLVASSSIFMASASSNFIPLSLGPDFTSTYSEKDILRGFKVNIAEGESPFKDKVFEGDIKPIPFSTTYAKSEVITSTEKLKNMLEIEGSLSVSYGPLISGEGSGRYLDNKVNSKRQATILYRTRRVAYARSIDVNTLEPSTNELYSLSGDQIADIYGTKFIDQMIYGAQLDVIFTVTSTTDIDLTEIEAEVKGKIGIGPLSIGFEAKFSKQEGSSSSDMTMSIVAQASGVPINPPPNPTFNKTNEIIEQFNARYDELLSSTADLDTIEDEANVLKQLSPVGFTLASVADYLPKLDEFEVAALDNKMSELRDVFYSALFWRSQLLAGKDIQEALYPDPRDREEIFQPYVGEMNRVIAKLDAKVEECLLFRRQPLASIIGRGGTFVPVPEMYPKSEQEINVVKGLKGDLYIPSPVVIGDSRFEQVHYIGFALPMKTNNDRLEPWMTGVVRRDSDNGIVTRADTVSELERITSFAVENSLPEDMEWGEVVNIRNFHSGNMLSADNIGNLRADGSSTQDRWVFVRSDCEGDYAYAGPCYEIRNADSPDRRMYAQIGENDQEGVGVGVTTTANKWVLKEADDCQGRPNCFFIVNAASGRRMLEHSNDFYTNFVSSSQDAKCSYKDQDRLFRTEDNSPVASVENCYELCDETPDCHYFSFGDNPANPAFKGVCIGCTKASSFDTFNGFNTYELGSGEAGVGAGAWADKKFNYEKWIIQISDESESNSGEPVPKDFEWGDRVGIKNLGSNRRLYLSSRGELKAELDNGSPDHKWIFARTKCEDSDHPSYLKYGDKIFLQSLAMSSRWLTGARGAGKVYNAGVVVRNMKQKNELDMISGKYKWMIQSSPGADRKNDCLRYGDEFSLQVGPYNLWLSGSRHAENEQVVTRNMFQYSHESSDNIRPTYQWIARSTLGTGEIDGSNNQDPAHGICIQDFSQVYLQNRYIRNRWLSGALGTGNEEVVTRNIFRSKYEFLIEQNYKWALKTVAGAIDGSDSLPTSADSFYSTCYEIIHANSGRLMLDQKWKLVESQCDDNTAKCFILENASSGMYLMDDGVKNGIVETPYFSDSQSSYKNQWVLERFAIQTPTQAPTDSPTAAPTIEIPITDMPVDAPIDGGGAMLGVFVTLPIVAFVGSGLAFLWYRRRQSKRVPTSKTVPTGVVLFSQEDPLGFLESGNNAKTTGGTVTTDEVSIVNEGEK